MISGMQLSLFMTLVYLLSYIPRMYIKIRGWFVPCLFGFDSLLLRLHSNIIVLMPKLHKMPSYDKP